MTLDHDYLVVGSGFGGAVSALRLAEKGWRVGLLEQGRRIGPPQIAKAKRNTLRLLWKPRLGLNGYFSQTFFRHLGIIGGVGLGGGSLVWGAVMLEPKPEFYQDPSLAKLGIDLEAELKPHFLTARRMFGVAANPRHTRQDELLLAAARNLGAGESFGPVPNAIYFGGAGSVTDPCFNGDGPPRTACSFCAGCLTGCEHGSKNSLDYNYLYFAERLGVRIITERKVERIEPLPAGGYAVTYVSTGLFRRDIQTITTKNLVVAAGVLGTLELLFKNRDKYRTLPAISPTLGQTVRTNSEAITAVFHKHGEDLSDGTAISSDFHPDQNTHITQNRFDRGYRFMRMFMVPMVDDDNALRRAIKSMFAVLAHPGLMLANWFVRDWEKRITAFTVMQDLDNAVRINYRRRLWGILPRGLATQTLPGAGSPSYLPIANRVTREYASLCGGEPMNTVMESVGALATTAHVLSGCPMGRTAADSVIDSRHQVHGYPGIYVVDGSSIPANIGVNPSLTIAAMAERFADLQPTAGEMVD